MKLPFTLIKCLEMKSVLTEQLVSQNTSSFIVSMVLLLSIGAPFPFHPALPKLFHCSITVSKQTIHPGHFDRPSFQKKPRSSSQDQRPVCSGENTPQFVGFLENLWPSIFLLIMIRGSCLQEKIQSEHLYRHDLITGSFIVSPISSLLV